MAWYRCTGGIGDEGSVVPLFSLRYAESLTSGESIFTADEDGIYICIIVSYEGNSCAIATDSASAILYDDSLTYTKVGVYELKKDDTVTFTSNMAFAFVYKVEDDAKYNHVQYAYRQGTSNTDATYTPSSDVRQFVFATCVSGYGYTDKAIDSTAYSNGMSPADINNTYTGLFTRNQVVKARAIGCNGTNITVAMRGYDRTYNNASIIALTEV